MRTTVAKLQQLSETEATEPFKHSWREHELVVVTDRSLGDDGPYQNAVNVSRGGTIIRSTDLASLRPRHE